MKVKRQVLECRKGRTQKAVGQGLCLVEDNHAVCYVVELPASGRPVRVKRLEELDVRRNDHGGIPVLRREALADMTLVANAIEVVVRMVLENVLLAKDVTEDLRRLLDD